MNTIAIGSKANTAGIEPINPEQPAPGEPKQVVPYAESQLRVKGTMLAISGLAELISAAYTDNMSCSPEAFESMMNNAAELIKEDRFSTRSLRSVRTHRAPVLSGNIKDRLTMEQRSIWLGSCQDRGNTPALAYGTNSSRTPDGIRFAPRLSHRHFHARQIVFFSPDTTKENDYIDLY